MAYDLCVLGAGPAGYAAAMRAFDLGKRVALIERGTPGGAGVKCGALSSKTFWHLSNDFLLATRLDRGFACDRIDVSYERVMREVRAAVGQKHEIIARQIAALGPAAGHAGSVTLVRGTASFVSAHEIAVTGETSSTVEADQVLIATGSSPRVPEGIEVDGRAIVTSDQIESLTHFPESMVIVGAGVVGCEYATAFSNFGRTRIFLIDRQKRILPFEDADVAEVIERNLRAQDVTIHRASKLESLRARDGGVEYVLTGEDGERQTYFVECALIATGRAANLAGLGLERIGVKTERGSVVVNGMRTTVPNIWAAGDVTADIALVNVAELEGRHAVETMFGLDPPALSYDALSTIMFLKPEVASVGLNEQQARAQKIPYRAAIVHNCLINRCIAMRETDGFIKLLAHREPPHKVLGLRVVGQEASSTIQGIALLIELCATLEVLDKSVHPHPAITEGVQECARLILGRSIMKPEVFGDEGLVRVVDYLPP